MRVSIQSGCCGALAALAAALLPLTAPAASAQAKMQASPSASPSGQVYQTRYGSLTASTLAIAFGSGESGGTVTITGLDSSPAPPPAGLEFGTLGEWSQAADGSVTISGSLYFLPDGGPAICQSWAADYSGQEETCWFNQNDVSYSELVLQ